MMVFWIRLRLWLRGACDIELESRGVGRGFAYVVATFNSFGGPRVYLEFAVRNGERADEIVDRLT